MATKGLSPGFLREEA